MGTILKSDKLLLTGTHIINSKNRVLNTGTSEVELIHAQIGMGVTKLDTNHLTDILKSIRKLGHVKAHTRNNSVINEVSGFYEKLYISTHNDKLTGIVINAGGVDLRLFLQNWHYIYLVETDTDSSIVFYDQYGCAIHKIMTTEYSDFNELINIRERFKVLDFSPINLEQVDETDIENTTLSQEKLDSFRQHWADLNDVHHFSSLLNKFTLKKMTAYQIIGNPWSKKVGNTSLISLLSNIKKSNLEIMVFTANKGIVQIYSGFLHEKNEVGQWLNAFGTGYNLYFKLADIKHMFVVRKPTDNGQTIISSIEFFDEIGNNVMTIFERRKEGSKQSESWQRLCDSL